MYSRPGRARLKQEDSDLKCAVISGYMGVFSGEVSRVSRRDARTSGKTTNYWGPGFIIVTGRPHLLSLPETSVKKHLPKVATMESPEREA
jgi:hypothetical protein